jgi:hypothetical protein
VRRIEASAEQSDQPTGHVAHHASSGSARLA